MKKVITACLLVSFCLAFSSCATLFNKTSVILYGYTSDLKVSENGQTLEPKLTYVGSSGIGTYGSVDYYGAGVRLKRSRKNHVITLEKGGKKVDVVLKSKFATGTLLADIFTSGIIGLGIDLAAGPLKTTKPKHIDVRGELGEAPRKSGHKLKKEFKKSFK